MANEVKDKGDTSEQQRKTALAIQHGLFVADQVLDIQVSSASSSITVGFVNPAGHLLPALTLKMPTLALVKMAEQVLSVAKSHKSSIKAEQDELLKLLK